MVGKVVLSDGLDLSGKGVFLRAMQARAEGFGHRVFDADAYCKEHGHLPILADLGGYDFVYLSEPTYQGVGSVIRNELISESAKNAGRSYSAEVTANAYSLDRHILLQNFENPAREAGKHILKSRSFLSSVVFQSVQARLRGDPLSTEDIFAMPGNMYARQSFDEETYVFLLTPPIETLMERMNRAKKDDCSFEKEEFQAAIKPVFESEWLREVIQHTGAHVYYPRTDGEKEDTVQLAHEYFDAIFR